MPGNLPEGSELEDLNDLNVFDKILFYCPNYSFQKIFV